MKSATGFSIRINQKEQTIAAVGKTGRGIWSVTNLSQAREDAPPPQDLAQTMAKQPGAITWLLPNDLAKVSVIPLPLLKGKELTRAVVGWVARSEQGTTSDYSISWNALPRIKAKADDPQQLVFSLHAEKKEVEEQLDNSLGRTLKPGRMLPGFMVIDQFFRMTHDTDEMTGSWNLVYLGTQENFLVIARDDCPLMTRSLPFDLSEGTEGAQYIDQLTTEIDRSGFYIRQGQHNPSIEKVILAGDPVLASSLAKSLAEKSDVSAEIWNIADHFTWGERPVPCSAFIPLMAAALSLEKDHFNLLPEIKRSVFGPAGRRRAMMAAGALGVGLLPVLLVGSTVTAKIQESYLQKARQRLEVARIDAQEAAEIYKQHRLLTSRQNYISTFLEERPDLESILLKIGAMAPGQVRFRDLRVNEDEQGTTRLTLTGESEAATSGQAQSAFLEFQKALESAPFLKTYTEPIKLEINGDPTGHGERPRTVFQMKFILITGQTEEG